MSDKEVTKQNLDPIKNEFVKPKMGRPLKFTTPEELEAVLTKYFNETDYEEWSVTGLALLVGSKQLLIDYENRHDYKDLVVRAKLMIENSYEISLRRNGKTTDIFALKNFGWKDRTEIAADHTVEATVTYLPKRESENENMETLS